MEALLSPATEGHTATKLFFVFALKSNTKELEYISIEGA